MDGIIIVDKPIGLTSHDVVDVVRKKFNIRRVGHAGSLDPLATGVLIILVGKTTRLFKVFENLEKEYLATLTLGVCTETSDSQGKILKTMPIEGIDETKLREVLNQFKGRIQQIPPMFSALKYKGKRLYNLARRGLTVPRQPREIEIFQIELMKFDPPLVDLRLVCSKGTYVRQICEDIGKLLGCGAYQSKLNRIRIGPFKIEEAVSLDNLNESHIRHNQPKTKVS
ncbi:MAG: tRNA pseudouridine(55) synthase TruB [Candidatus Omnitrophota bacterium]